VDIKSGAAANIRFVYVKNPIEYADNTIIYLNVCDMKKIEKE